VSHESQVRRGLQHQRFITVQNSLKVGETFSKAHMREAVLLAVVQHIGQRLAWEIDTALRWGAGVV
jgi:hypothetical protein